MSGGRFGRPRSGWPGRRASAPGPSTASAVQKERHRHCRCAGRSQFERREPVVHPGRPPPRWGGVAPARGRRPQVQEYRGHRPVHSTMWGRLGSSKPTRQCAVPGRRVGIRATGLTPSFPNQVGPDWQAPAVEEAAVRMGLTLLNDLNSPTHAGLMQGSGPTPSDVVQSDGYVDLEAADTVAISGLTDTTTQSLGVGRTPRQTVRSPSLTTRSAVGKTSQAESCLLGCTCG